MDIDDKIVEVLANCMYASAYWCRQIDYDHDKFPAGKYEYIEQKFLDILIQGERLEFILDEPFEDDDKVRYSAPYSRFVEVVKKYDEDYIGDYSDDVLQEILFGEVVFG